MKKTRAQKIIGIIISLAVIGVIAYFAVHYRVLIYNIITSKTAREEFIVFVRESGFKGVAAFIGLQLLQIIVAVIPGEPVELMAGVLYGTFGGLGICLLGVFIGNVIIYGVVKLLGAKSIDEETFHKYRFLRDKKNVELILFLMFFIPGTPKDILIYIGPFIPVKPMTFFLISTLARIPSIITSTYAAATLINGHWVRAIVLFAITGAVAVVCILAQDKIIAKLNSVKEKANRLKDDIKDNIKENIKK